MKVDLNKISSPYAEALLELAKANKTLTKTRSDANLVLEFMSNSSELKEFLSNPVITRDVKKRFVKDLFREKIGYDTLKFALLLVEKNRINIVEKVLQKFIILCDEEEKIETVKVTSSLTVPIAAQEEIIKQMQHLKGPDKRICLSLKEDPEIIAGYILEFGSTKVDISVRGQLEKISTFLGA